MQGGSGHFLSERTAKRVRCADAGQVTQGTWVTSPSLNRTRHREEARQRHSWETENKSLCQQLWVLNYLCGSHTLFPGTQTRLLWVLAPMYLTLTLIWTGRIFFFFFQTFFGNQKVINDLPGLIFVLSFKIPPRLCFKMYRDISLWNQKIRIRRLVVFSHSWWLNRAVSLLVSKPTQ